MIRPPALLVLVTLAAVASAQQGQQPTAAREAQPITGTIRNAGTYHVATDTWTRKTSQENLGTNVIYNNTCTPLYMQPLSDDSFIDEGRIPSPSGPSNANEAPGSMTQYAVDGFQLMYCTDQPSMGTYTVNFYESYASCTSVIGVVPTAGFAINGLPAAPAGGAACWFVSIDLDSPPQSLSLAFVMLADGAGSYQGPTASLFGWEMRSSLGAAAAHTGPVLAGDFSICSGYDGTIWDPNPFPGEAGTGMSTQNQYRVEGGTTTPGCYFFGGVPVSSFFLKVFANSATDTSGTAFCAGDGTGVQCPCGNHSSAGSGDGCLHSLGVGGRLRSAGTASILNDSVVLYGRQMPPTSSALYFQGTLQQNGGAGSPFGDGKRCAGGMIHRIGAVSNSGGTSHYPRPGDPPVSVRGLVTTPGTRTYQIWYRNAAAFCTPSTFNLTNGVEFAWGA